MWDRLLLAMDQFDSGQAALDFTTGLAASSGADVRVFHARELSKSTRVPPLETVTDAHYLVDEAVFRLRLANIGAEGRACSAREEQVASRIVDEASHWRCDAIVLGSRRLRGISRLSGWGVRERILRLSPLPVIVTPQPLLIGKRRPMVPASDAVDEDGDGARSRRH
jgi:nucleotide-binding universal stress UspA family protein